MVILAGQPNMANAAMEAMQNPQFQQSLSRMFEPLFNWASKRYTAAVGAQLKEYGLRYDDLYDPLHDLDIDEALKRLPQEVIDARNQRLKRAIDLSMKHIYLPKEIQDQQKPFEPYLEDMLERVKMENNERYSVGAGRPYDRHFP